MADTAVEVLLAPSGNATVSEIVKALGRCIKALEDPGKVGRSGSRKGVGRFDLGDQGVLLVGGLETGGPLRMTIEKGPTARVTVQDQNWITRNTDVRDRVEVSELLSSWIDLLQTPWLGRETMVPMKWNRHLITERLTKWTGAALCAKGIREPHMLKIVWPTARKPGSVKVLQSPAAENESTISKWLETSSLWAEAAHAYHLDYGPGLKVKIVAASSYTHPVEPAETVDAMRTMADPDMPDASSLFTRS
jgi:hypothetical protein